MMDLDLVEEIDAPEVGRVVQSQASSSRAEGSGLVEMSLHSRAWPLL